MRSIRIMGTKAFGGNQAINGNDLQDRQSWQRASLSVPNRT